MRFISRTLTPVTFVGALMVSGAASAQSIDIVAPAPQAEAAANPADILRSTIDPGSDPALSDDAALAAALDYDPFNIDLPRKSWHTPVSSSREKSTTWSGGTKADGSGSISVNKTLSTEWDASIGGDLSLAGTQNSTYDFSKYDPTKPLPGTVREQRAGSAWANVTVPDFATVEVRVAPSDEQRKFGTTVQRSMPVGGYMSVTLQNDLSITENVGITSATAQATPAQIWDSQRKIKFNIAPTGTTFAAASTNSSVESITHHILSAEQKLYGGLNVTTSVTDPGQTTSSKSITAGYKLSW